jgi:hypothetical protein
VTGKKAVPWVGDQVYDAHTGRECVVSDVRDGTTYVLRHLHGGGRIWTVPSAETLTVTVPREERVDR